MRWRGPRKPTGRREPQVANAHKGFADLTPVSEAPAEAVRAAWDPVLVTAADYREEPVDEFDR